MSLRSRVERLETVQQEEATWAGANLEDLSDEELEAIVRASPYDLSRLTDEELIAMRDRYSEPGASEFFQSRGRQTKRGK